MQYDDHDNHLYTTPFQLVVVDDDDDNHCYMFVADKTLRRGRS